MLKHKKRIFLLGSIAIGSVLAVTLPLTAELEPLKGIESYDWGHYSRVAPTLERNGSKEYWINCSTHEIQFTKPGTGTIVDKGAPSVETFVKKLSSTDSRYLPKYTKSVSFEDGVIPEFLNKKQNCSLSVSSSTASEGSKCLQVSLSNSFKIFASTEWIDTLFAEASGPIEILFDAKATTQINNFYFESATDTYKVKRYEVYNGSGLFGLDTYWKTFHFTKAMYSDLLANGALFRIDSSSGQTLYIDNIRINNLSSSGIGFDEGDVIATTANKQYSYRDRNNNQVAYFTSELNTSGFTVTPNDSYHSNGTTSLHIQTTAVDKVSFYINSSFYNSLDENGALFDIYVPASATNFEVLEDYAVHSKVVYYDPVNFTMNGKWITFHAKKESIGASRLMLFRTSSNGSRFINDFYLDNVRPYTLESIDFEDCKSNVFWTNNHSITPSYNAPYHAIADNLNPNTALGNEVITSGSGFADVSIDSSVSTSNARSLKAATSSSYGAISLSARMAGNEAFTAFRYDVMVKAPINVYLGGNTSKVGNWWSTYVDTWTTILIKKSDMDSGNVLFSINGQSANEIHIDNIRGLTLEEYNQALLNKPADGVWPW